MPKAVENKQTSDPMKDVVDGFNYEKFVGERYFKKQLTYGLKEAALHYKHVTGCTDEEATVYKDVIEKYFEGVSTAMIRKNYPYLWYKMGEFYIAKFNGCPKLSSYKSAQYKQIVSFVNLHTSGWTYMFYWHRSRSVFYNRDYYQFRAYDGNEKNMVGRYGLKTWIKKLHADNMLVDYNAFVRNGAMEWKRRKKREDAREKEKQAAAEKLKLLL